MNVLVFILSDSSCTILSIILRKKISSVITFNYYYKEKLETVAIEFCCVNFFSEGNILVHNINPCELTYKSNTYFNKVKHNIYVSRMKANHFCSPLFLPWGWG